MTKPAPLRPIETIASELEAAELRAAAEPANDVIVRVVERLRREKGSARFVAGRFAVTVEAWRAIERGERAEPLSPSARRRVEAEALRAALGPADPALVALVSRALRS